MKSLIAVALFALASTGAFAAKVRQLPKPLPAPAADATADQTLTSDDVRGQVRAYLGSIDTAITAAQWKVLGQRAESPLLDVVQGEELPTRRAKAIDGLSAVGTGQTALLKTIASNEKEPFVVRFASLRALGNLLPEPEMITQLSTVMSSAKDLRVRAAAGSVLAMRSPKAACPAVKAQIVREDKASRDQFARAMDACFAQ